MSANVRPGRVRLAELVAALSLGVDLGFGQPMEHVLRQCLIGLRLADRVGLDEEARSVVYYTALLVNVGCHTDAHEQARWFGDDIALKALKYDPGPGLHAAVESWRRIGAGGGAIQRLRSGVAFLRTGRHDVEGMMALHAQVARGLAEELGLPERVLDAVGAAYEHWNGRGWPGRLRGEQIPIAARIAQLAEYVEVAHRSGGVHAATALARKRGGRHFDPTLVSILCSAPDEILRGLDTVGVWDAVIAGEPSLAVTLTDAECDRALVAIAHFVDVKSPHWVGHSAGVAELVAAAGSVLGLSHDDIRTLRRAGLVHDFGRLGVSNVIWDKPGPLGAGEWERVRLHPYLTERMLHRSMVLAPLGAIAVQHRERLDGSGYPRGLAGAEISGPARILAAADAYHAMLEPRAHRSAHSALAAAMLLRDEVRRGRLDGNAVEAVLAAAGHRVPRRRQGPAGLTTREVDVLRLIAAGLSTKQIAVRLELSPKTAGNHIEHIYSKIGVSNRVTASLYALRHGLLPADEIPTGDEANSS